MHCTSPTPRIVAIGVLLGMALGCGPKSTNHRRVVTGPGASALPVDSPDVAPVRYDWPSGARHFDAIDPKGSPRVIWRMDIGHSLVHPLMTDGMAVYGAGGSEVFKVAADGTRSWTASVNAIGNLSVRASGVAVPTTDETIVELDLEHGSVAHTHPTGGLVAGYPVPLQGELLWVTRDGRVSAETGWAVQGSDSAIGTSTSDNLHVYFGTRTGEVVAVSRARARWRAVLPGAVVGGLVSADGMVYASYLGDLGRPGGVAAIAADSGTIAWRTPLSEDPSAGPALGSTLVVADRGGEIVGLDLATGDVLWRTEVSGAAATTPAFGRFGLYVGNADGRLHRLDPDDGGEVWSIDLGATPAADPVVLPGLVVVGLSNGSLVAVGGE